MAISIDNLIPVNGTVVSTGFNGVTLSELILTENPLVPVNDTQRVLQFNSAALVGAYFGLTSDEYAASINYFNSFVGNLNIPPYLLFGRYVTDAVTAYIRGGVGPSLAILQDILDGTLILEFNGSEYAPVSAAVATGTGPIDISAWNHSGTNYLTIVNTTAATISTFSWNGTAWVVVGSPVATGVAPFSIATFTIGATAYAAVTNNVDNTISVYSWSGSAFVALGSSPIATGVGAHGITDFIVNVNNVATQFLAVTNNTDGTITPYSWNGTTFVAETAIAVGTGPYQITSFDDNLGNTYLATTNDNDDTVTLLVWTGTQFTVVGEAIEVGSGPKGISTYYLNDEIYLAVCNYNENTFSTLKFNGTVLVSAGPNISTVAGPIDVAFTQNFGVSYLTFSCTGASKIQTFAWNGSTWVVSSTKATGTSPRGLDVSTIAGINYVSVVNFGANTFSPFVWGISSTTLTALNFSAATSLSQVAAIVQAAMVTAGISLATCTYSSLSAAFTISNGDLSGGATIGYCPVSDVATAMKLTQVTGAVLSQGLPAQTPAENMQALANITSNWMGFTNIFDLSSDLTYAIQIGLAQWAVAQQNKYVYLLWDSETNLTIPGNSSNIAYAFVDAGLATLNADNSITWNCPVSPWYYSSVALTAFVGGIGGSINYNAVNGTLSFAQKTQAGLTANVTTDTAYQTLILNGFNLYGSFSAAAQTYNSTINGNCGGQYQWLDNIYNQRWLADQLQNVAMTYFQSVLKSPNNDQGYTVLNNVLTTVMNAAINNGTVQPGNFFDATTVAVLNQQAGYDISDTLTQQGYFIQIVPVSPANRGKRVPPIVNIWYTNAGSFYRLPINTIFVL